MTVIKSQGAPVKTVLDLLTERLNQSLTQQARDAGIVEFYENNAATTMGVANITFALSAPNLEEILFAGSLLIAGILETFKLNTALSIRAPISITPHSKGYVVSFRGVGLK